MRIHKLRRTQTVRRVVENTKLQCPFLLCAGVRLSLSFSTTRGVRVLFVSKAENSRMTGQLNVFR